MNVFVCTNFICSLYVIIKKQPLRQKLRSKLHTLDLNTSTYLLTGRPQWVKKIVHMLSLVENTVLAFLICDTFSPPFAL